MRPASITMFDRLFLGALAVGFVNFILNYESVLEQVEAEPGLAVIGGMPFLIGTLIIGNAINLLLWFLIARRASNVAKWILVVLTGFSLLSLFSLPEVGALQAVITLVILALQLAAIYFLFRADAKAWFKHGPNGMDPDVFE